VTNLPPNWVLARLGDIALWSSGGTPKSGTSEYYGGAIPWVVTGDLTNGLVQKSTQTITHLGLAKSSAKLVPPGTLLVAMYGASIGRVGIAGVNLATNQAIANAQIYAEVAIPEYVMYYLLSQRQALVAAGRGAAQPNIGQGVLKEWPIPIAPLAEQQRIVSAIEEQFSQLDAGVAALERTRRNLKRMRAAVLQAAVNTNQELAAPSVPLRDLVPPGRKIAYGVLVPGDDDPEGVPIVRVGDLSDRHVKVHGLKQIGPAIAARYPRTRLQGGEVLLSLVGTIGRAAVVPPDLAGANTARALGVIPVQEAVDSRYVAIALSCARATKELIDLAHEVARKTLNLEDVRRYEIPLPSHAEQTEIVEAVETAEAWITSVDEVVERSFLRAGRARASILASAFSGRLVHQDPGDESASLLVERIQTDRTRSNGHKLTRTRKIRLPQETVSL
jgi:type I restriction enzyme S subunit